MPDTEAAGFEGMSPQYARAVEAKLNWWRSIESERAFVDVTETEAELIRADRLLGHRHGGTYRRSTFQLDTASGEVLPVVTALLDAIRGYQVPAGEGIM